MNTPSRWLGALALTVSTIIVSATPPPAPQNVRAAWVADQFPTFMTAPYVQWEPSPGANSYNVYRADDTNTAWTVAATNVTTPFFFDPLFSFLPSYYFVTAVNADGESAGSAPATATEQYGGTITVYDIRQEDGSLTSSNALVRWYTSLVAGDEGMVEWGPSLSGETNYVFYLENTNYLPGHTFTLTNLSPATVYQFRITSIGANRGGLRWSSSFATPETNRPPVAEDLDYSSFIFPTNGVNLTLRGYDSNFPPLTLTFRIVSSPTNGTLGELQSGWEWNTAYINYTPAPIARGIDRFQFVVNNGVWDSVPATVTVSNWVNTKPVTIMGDVVTTAEDTPISFALPVFDAEGDPVSFSFPGFPWNGTISGEFPNPVFTPNSNYVGSASFSYEVTDGFETSWGWIQIDVTPVNDKAVLITNGMPPLVAYEDMSLQFNLWFHDVDWSSEYEVLVITPPAHGSLSNLTTQITYWSETNYFGFDSFTLALRETDGTTSDPQTYIVEVRPMYDAPIGLDQDVTMLEDTSVAITPTGFDVDSPVLTFQIRNWPQHGWLEDTGTNYIYRPLTNYVGTDEFTFDAVDEWGITSFADPGIVRITILPVGEPPVADVIAFFVHQDAFVNGYFNVFDTDGSPLTCEIMVQPTNGIVTVNGTNFTYWPATGYQGHDSFTFRAFDGEFYSDVTNVFIFVNGPNNPPTAWDLTTSTAQDTPATFWLPVNDPDPYDPLTGIVATPPQNGAVQFNGINATYYPNPGFFGTDSFTFWAFDGITNGNLGTVTITVVPPNRPPIVYNSSASGNEDTSIPVAFTATDPDGNTLSYLVIFPPTNGVLSGTGANRTYQPNPNFSGTDSVRFRVSDGEYTSGLATVTITVTPVNDTPVASNGTVTAYEDYPVTFALTGSDVDSGGLLFSIVTPPAHGTLTTGNRVRTYTPSYNYNGPDSFTFRITDGSTTSAVATVSINVLPLNDEPHPVSQLITNYEDTSFPITLTGTDVDGDSLTFGIALAPHDGTLSGTPPNLIYTPNPNFNGGESFLFWVSDGSLTTTNGIAIVVLPVNDAPAANSQSLSAVEDTDLNITLTGSDIEGSALTFSVVSAPTNGTLSGTVPNLVYTPAANFNGADSFTFVANDGDIDSAPATIILSVVPANDSPVANTQTVTVAEDATVGVTLTGTDTDGDVLSYAIVADPTNGVLTGTAPNLTYTPGANFNGSDSFAFAVSDGNATNVAAVDITVTPVNDVPVAQSGGVNVAEDGSSNLTLTGTDIDGDALTFSVASGPTSGTLSGSGANLVYTPAANFNGTDSFTFIVNDGTVDSAPATVSITVTAVNDAPVANAQSVNLAEDGTATISLTGSDVDGDSLAYSISVPPTNGMLAGTAPNLTYTPSANFNGSDSFSFAVSDGNATNVGTVTITVTPVNDAPAAQNGSVTVLEDGSAGVILTGTDGDGDALTFSVAAAPANGTLSGSGANLVYTPAANFNGTDSFTFVVNDGTVDSAPATVSITITAVNDAPIANAQSVSVAEDGSTGITMTGSDVDADTLNYSVTVAPTNGVLTGTAPNLTYTPNANFNGSDNFAFAVSDGTASNVASITITVTPVNDTPVANAQSVSVAEDGTISVTLAGSDIDGDSLSFSVASAPVNGALSGSGANLVYAPAANFNGTDSFTFIVNDGTVDSASATVSITVTAVNDAPVANAQSVSVVEDGSLPIALSGSDIDGNPLFFSVVSAPTHGTLSGTAPNVTYTPDANYHGPDSFTFTVNDGTANSAAVVVNITVTSVNDAPLANAQSVTATYNTAQSITLAGSDLEGSTLTYTLVSTPTNGTLSGTAPNLTYTPNVGSAGADHFTFRVNDGADNSTDALVSITTQNPSSTPATPTSLVVTVPTASGTLILSWNSSSTNEDGFKIERSSNGNNGWTQIATTGINVHTYTNSGLSSNTRYYYRVRAFNRLGNSAYSNTANGRTR